MNRNDAANDVSPTIPHAEVGVVVVDHGSRQADSNRMLLRIVEMFRERGPFTIVEPAHMELAEPTLAAAFARCVERGAKRVVVHPYFLLPGRHWREDIPALAAAAASQHPGIDYLVTAPLATHPLLAEVIAQRVEQCLARLAGDTSQCDACEGRADCRLHRGLSQFSRSEAQ